MEHALTRIPDQDTKRREATVATFMLSAKRHITKVPREFVNVVMLMDTHNRVRLNCLIPGHISSIYSAHYLASKGIPNGNDGRKPSILHRIADSF